MALRRGPVVAMASCILLSRAVQSLGFILGLHRGYTGAVTENQMQKKIENEIEAGIIG